MRIFLIMFTAVVISIILNFYTESFIGTLFIFIVFLGTGAGLILSDALDITTSIIALAIIGVLFFFFMA